MSTYLNYKIEGQGQPIVLIHGLFGNLDNLGLLVRNLKEDHQVISLDLRNHGLSFHDEEHNYAVMALDVARTLKSIGAESATIIGHSMGGKVAMKLTEVSPNLVLRLIVLDMAPVAYPSRSHDQVFSGLFAVIEQKPTTRQQAMSILAKHIKLDGVRQFLGKSLYKAETHFTWRFNVQELYQNYEQIIGWQSLPSSDIPTLFVKGENSDYITSEHQSTIRAQFPNAKAHIIANTGHWLHAEKPDEVLRVIRKFLNQ
ncbi:alpha/beta fold hydrolase [Vibrio sp. RC27]